MTDEEKAILTQDVANGIMQYVRHECKEAGMSETDIAITAEMACTLILAAHISLFPKNAQESILNEINKRIKFHLDTFNK